MQINGCTLQHNVEWKKPNQKNECIIFNSIFIKFKNRQSQFMVVEPKLVAILGDVMNRLRYEIWDRMIL